MNRQTAAVDASFGFSRVTRWHERKPCQRGFLLYPNKANTNMKRSVCDPYMANRRHLSFFLGLLVGLFVFADNCFAHADRILGVEPDGTITSLPSEFLPARLRVDFESASDKPAISSLRLLLGRHETTLPTCITKLLRTPSMDGVQVAASWYHETTSLPYYIHLDFYDPPYNNFYDPPYDKTRNFEFKPGYTLLFNLRTGELMWFHQIVVNDRDRSAVESSIDIEAICSPDEIRALRPSRTGKEKEAGTDRSKP